MHQFFLKFFPFSIVVSGFLMTGCSGNPAYPSKFESVNSTNKPGCMSLMDDSGYEMVEGFNGDGYYVSGYVTKNRKQKPEGCFVDDWGVEAWFIGDWISRCQIESINEKGKKIDLQTDDCWTERGFL